MRLLGGFSRDDLIPGRAHQVLMIGLALEFKCREEGQEGHLWALEPPESSGSRAVYWLRLSLVENGHRCCGGSCGIGGGFSSQSSWVPSLA